MDGHATTRHAHKGAPPHVGDHGGRSEVEALLLLGGAAVLREELHAGRRVQGLGDDIGCLAQPSDGGWVGEGGG